MKHRWVPAWIALALLLGLAIQDSPAADLRSRRILYNLDGDSCMTLIAGRQGPGPVDTNDLARIVTELTAPGSQVDTFLLCANAQVLYYPTRVGTQRGALSTEVERAAWSAHERQRFTNLASFFASGIDPYAFLFAEARRRGLETLLTFRMNDAHGNDFLRTAFWRDHPRFRLGNGALDFRFPEVRDYVLSLIEEAARRYDTDGIELDFQRFPTYFGDDATFSVDARVAAMSDLVRRVRSMLNATAGPQGRRRLLALRPPSPYGRTPPTPDTARSLGCDVAAWAKEGWIDWVTVSEFLFVRYDLPLRAWKEQLPNLPIYGGIECAEGSALDQCMTPARYRRAARHLWSEGAAGIYLFNFFTTREWTDAGFEPPWEVLTQIGSPASLARFPIGPWETNTPLAAVEKNLHASHPRPQAAAMASMLYVGPGLERREWRAVESRDDVADDQSARWSTDNGRTWSEWTPQQPSSLVDYAGTKVWEGGWADTHDPKSGLLVQAWLRQIEIRGIFHCFPYVRTSRDLGRSWSMPSPLRYEEAPAFDPQQPAHPSFLNRNEGYPGNNIAALADGTLLHAVAHANAVGDPKNDQRPWRMGSVLFLGRWDVERQAYAWEAGARTEISPTLSARGLMEPEVAVLRDHRILIVWRGSNTGWDGTRADAEGRKWFSLSEDGGRTLSPPSEWRYADGTRFFSPSSIHRMIRHSQTGKLYWFGNLCPMPPDGNHPRFPLVMAEVDETAAAIRRETVTLIADRMAYHGPLVQFSNFSLLEDRQTHHFELFLTTYGQRPDPKEWATADNFRFRVTLK
ncbi:MAG: hypothetical protein JNK85_19790 [Verrucomicrobiales bacterium]|nr:hypothetical protein [Verrucomicrobiales bacterium]